MRHPRDNVFRAWEILAIPRGWGGGLEVQALMSIMVIRDGLEAWEGWRFFNAETFNLMRHILGTDVDR